MTRKRLALVALIAAAALSAAACGDDAADDEPATSTLTTGATAETTEPSATPTTSAAPATTGALADDGALVQEGDLISVHYVGTLDDGEQFDSSRDRGQPLSFTVGSGQMISGFDAAVRGMAIGEVKTVRLEATEAYGERTDEAIIEVPLSQVPEGTEVGDELVANTGQRVTVIEVTGDIVRVDANHPLAGEALTFEIEIVAIGE